MTVPPANTLGRDVLECRATDPAHVARELKRALALLLCAPRCTDMPTVCPCADRLSLVEPLVRPLGHALFVAASGEEHPRAFDNPNDRRSCAMSQDKYEAIGRAIEVIERAAGMGPFGG